MQMLILGYVLFLQEPLLTFDYILKEGVTQFFVGFSKDLLALQPCKDSLCGEYRLAIQCITPHKLLFGNEVFREQKFPKDEVPKRFIDSLEIKIPKGKYEVRIIVEDMNTGKKEEIKDRIEIEYSPFETIFITDSKNKMIIGRALEYEDTLVFHFSHIPSPTLYSLTINAKSEKETFTIATLENIPPQFIYPICKLKSGEYEFEINIFKDKKRVYKRRWKVFASIPFYLDDEEYIKKVEQLIYVATPQEIKILKTARREERQKLWEEFWKPKDPIPQTPKNEAEEEYFRKIEYCEKNFRRGDKGYLSDRARVYMKYGEPDEIEYHTMEREFVNYQVWYYRSGRKFIFADKHGFGEYILVYPSKFGI